MDKAYDFLGGLTPETFLRDYWQKKPLLVRNAFPDIASLLGPDELAGLALESSAAEFEDDVLEDKDEVEEELDDGYEFENSGVESRIIRSKVDDNGNTRWTLDHGPFTEAQLKALPDKDWTLLVQAVDMYQQDVASLLDVFSFIPRWRMDDVMISLAAPGGSVGPHYDRYDVFLIQGIGQRHWQIGQQCSAESPLIKHPDLRILTDMDIEQEWTLNPGDMLYLPPLVAHHGVAIDNCMTYSVGFRAPGIEDLFDKLTHHVTDKYQHDGRYTDPELSPQKNSGWLSDQAVAKVQALMMARIQDSNQLRDWLAQVVTEPKYAVDYEDMDADEQAELSPKALLQLLAQDPALLRDEYSRYVYTGQENQAEKFYINGNEIPLPDKNLKEAQQLVIYLCNNRYYHSETLRTYFKHQALCEWFISLLQKGYFYIQE